jgi:hypothetical protein
MHKKTLYAIAYVALCGLPLGLAAWALVWAPVGETPPEPSPVAVTMAAERATPLRSQPLTAQFGRQAASEDVRHIARWVFHSGDHAGRAVVVVDKREARVYVFDPHGSLQGATPALLGSAIGDHTVPGVGDKPIDQVLPAERTTPAGRFVAEPGTNAKGEDVVWVDYDAAVSMHRVRPLVKAERRLERLASRTPRDNRISYGCINLPVRFYEDVLSPAVRTSGAVVYVLPETQPAAQWFGAYAMPAGAVPEAAPARAHAGGALPRRAATAGTVRHGLRPADDARAATAL